MNSIFKSHAALQNTHPEYLFRNNTPRASYAYPYTILETSLIRTRPKSSFAIVIAFPYSGSLPLMIIPFFSLFVIFFIPVALFLIIIIISKYPLIYSRGYKRTLPFPIFESLDPKGQIPVKSNSLTMLFPFFEAENGFVCPVYQDVNPIKTTSIGAIIKLFFRKNLLSFNFWDTSQKKNNQT